MVDTLASLAFDFPRRSTFFRQELKSFLILSKEQGLNPLDVYGSYLEDTADVSANGNNVGNISFDLRLYPVNGEKFNLYIGPEVGYSFLEIRKLNPSLGNIEEVSNYSGGHFGVNLGFNWYLFSFAGVFAQAEYTRNDFTLKQYYIDGETFDLTNWDASLNTFSGAVRVGLCFKIN